MRTKVAIVGAGPAGLMLGQLLSQMNISNIIVESRSREYVEGRSRAGQITPATVRILTQSGLGERVHAEGMKHSTLQFHYDGSTRELDFEALTGQTVMIYGQQEIIKDLVAARSNWWLLRKCWMTTACRVRSWRFGTETCRSMACSFTRSH
ncbi:MULTISPECIES: FAD-dependent monooxygenase [unclassified Pseudomonas]|uniref:FAD-dependent monooxygenase n=1 Tax=unclassified Pseudomonas TaxID=196821 RepID=UPI00249C6A0F|nr:MULTISPECIES: FAD-dependent monooxygenase [unclassified Pseudomonas]